jgi:fermentation-respiration switch protein FrsA (DUF1100 family)
VTLRSTRAARMYEPGIWVSRVSPTPLLMVVARDDKLTVADLALAAYERALEPKRLALIPGGHYGRFGGRECCSDRASELMGEKSGFNIADFEPKFVVTLKRAL